MSIFVIRNSHELHQLKKALLLLRESMTTVSYTHLFYYCAALFFQELFIKN